MVKKSIKAKWFTIESKEILVCPLCNCEANFIVRKTTRQDEEIPGYLQVECDGCNWKTNFELYSFKEVK